MLRELLSPVKSQAERWKYAVEHYPNFVDNPSFVSYFFLLYQEEVEFKGCIELETYIEVSFTGSRRYDVAMLFVIHELGLITSDEVTSYFKDEPLNNLSYILNLQFYKYSFSYNGIGFVEAVIDAFYDKIDDIAKFVKYRKCVVEILTVLAIIKNDNGMFKLLLPYIDLHDYNSLELIMDISTICTNDSQLKVVYKIVGDELAIYGFDSQDIAAIAMLAKIVSEESTLEKAFLKHIDTTHYVREYTEGFHQAGLSLIFIRKHSYLHTSISKWLEDYPEDV